MKQLSSLLGKSTKVLKKYGPLAFGLLGMALVQYLTHVVSLQHGVGGGGLLFAPLPSTPTLDIDFTSALSTIFDYAELIFGVLIGVAAIGIGFRFGLALISWVSDMIGQAFRFR